MQIRVSLELVGEPEEVGLLLAQIGETIVGDEFDEDAKLGDEIDAVAWWTPERAQAFVHELTGPALQALSVIASHPPRLSFRDL